MDAGVLANIFCAEGCHLPVLAGCAHPEMAIQHALHFAYLCLAGVYLQCSRPHQYERIIGCVDNLDIGNGRWGIMLSFLVASRTYVRQDLSTCACRGGQAAEPRAGGAVSDDVTLH